MKNRILQQFLILMLILGFNSFAQDAGYKVKFKELKEENTKLRYKISAFYPVISGHKNKDAEEKFNAKAFQLVYDAVGNFKNDMKDWEAPKDFTSEFEITDSVWYQSDKLISIRFDGYQYYAGAAHPLTFFFSMIYDLKNNKEVTLGDMFTGNYLKAISELCIKDLIRQKNEYTENPDVSWIEEGAAPKDSNYMVYNITESSLLITFPVYQVASYAEGPREVNIPFPDLKKFIKPDGPLAEFKDK